MSRLPAPLYPAAARRNSRRSTPPTDPKRPAYPNLPTDQRDPESAPTTSRAWLVLLIGMIAGAAYLAMQVNQFLYG